MSDAEITALRRLADTGDVDARGKLERALNRTRDEQDAALELMLSGRSCFLTGAGGTGKSYLVRRFLGEMRRQRRPVAVAASTGVAAIALGGSTLHRTVGLSAREEPRVKTESVLGWDTDAVPTAETPLGGVRGFNDCASVREFLAAGAQSELAGFEGEQRVPVVPSALVVSSYKEPWRMFTAERLRAIECLVLDETSMIDGKVLDAASWLCAQARGIDKPFGELQVVFVGDFGQLPPVEGERWGWAFESAAWRAIDPVVIELTQVRRQSDQSFSGLLGRLRKGEVAPADARTILSRVGAFDPRGCVRILSTNAECDVVNAREFAALAGQKRVHVATERGPDALLREIDKGCPSARRLELKVGCRVLLTANDPSPLLRWANGTAAVVREIGVDVDDPSGLGGSQRCVRVETAHGDVLVPTATWDLQETGRDGVARVVASRTQYPFRLGYAITAHRAQGSTLDRASVNLEKTFTAGQAYVALSRVRSLEGLNLESSKHGVLRAHEKFLAWEATRRVSA